jgi:hypothetical protein
MTALSDAIKTGWDEARADDPEPTVRYVRDLLGQYPGDARARFEYASALDFAGREAEAVPVCEQSFSAGLDGEDLRRGLIQYGSTLRNAGRFDEAVSAVRRADERFPGHSDVAAFLALALASAGRGPEAVARLIMLALVRIGDDDLGPARAPSVGQRPDGLKISGPGRSGERPGQNALPGSSRILTRYLFLPWSRPMRPGRLVIAMTTIAAITVSGIRTILILLTIESPLITM